MATAAWHPSASSERRSEYAMNVDNPAHSSSVASRPVPPPSEINRWDLAEILNPNSAGSTRDRKMSTDFSSSSSTQPQPGLYGQELDQGFNLHNPDTVSSSSSHNHLSGNIPSHTFDHGEGLDAPQHSSYDLFSNSAQSSSFASQRYRTNASSSSSLGPSYGINGEAVYSHPSFGDSVPSFPGSNSNPYDVINSLPSSYSSGKVSPLTPNDPVGGLHHSSAFPPSVGGNKDYIPQGYPDLVPDRRLSNVSNGNYQSDFSDEYTIGSVNSGLPFPPPNLQHFPDRLGRFQPDGRFAHPPGPPPAVPSHLPPNHDILRGVAPHATHSFRPEGGVPAYEDMPHYMGPMPHSDMSLRMPAVDEALARIKLQGHSMMGASNDLQTFIRHVLRSSFSLHSLNIF
jgi:recombining binding protein (suppressor of hairless)